jgi:tRNA (mo5U34)-methyltransferase
VPEPLCSAPGVRRAGGIGGPCVAPGLLKGPPVGVDGVLNVPDQASLRDALMVLHPWRKGPFPLHGIDIDSVWRSEWKWERLIPHLSPLAGRRVLAVGCGNGYPCWPALGTGAELALGVDPTVLYVIQFLALARQIGCLPAAVLPLVLEDLPTEKMGFDTAPSEGVLYHRRSRTDHFAAFWRLMCPGGDPVLETLLVEGDADRVLIPPGRYAGMRNVWFIPSAAALMRWLGHCGFSRGEAGGCQLHCPLGAAQQ